MTTDRHPTREELIDFQHRALEPAADAAVLTHIENCVPCAAIHDEEARLTELVRAHARSERFELPLGFAAATLARARERERSHYLERFLSWWRPAVAVPAAVFFVLAAFLAPVVLPHLYRPTSQINALHDLRDHAALMATEPFEESSQAPIVLASDRGNAAP
uniref:Zinc-finger domain-containing protein n=1 Tax=mine drainage metagenome TaxID=410659 RepID=E6Q5F1_9ZZZZ